MERHADWLEEQDIPQPRLRAPRIWKPRSPRIYATMPSSASKGKQKAKKVSDSPSFAADRGGDDDLFEMDEEVVLPPAVRGSSIGGPPQTPQAFDGGNKGSPWRSQTAEVKKLDLRSIMAEAEQIVKPLSVSPVANTGKYIPPISRKSINGTPVTPSRPGASPLPATPSALADKATSWRTTTPTASPVVSGSSSAFPSLGAAKPTPSRVPSSSNAQAGPSKSDIIVPGRQTAARKPS